MQALALAAGGVEGGGGGMGVVPPGVLGTDGAPSIANEKAGKKKGGGGGGGGGGEQKEQKKQKKLSVKTAQKQKQKEAGSRGDNVERVSRVRAAGSEQEGRSVQGI
jgi:hypothetical protein